MPRLVELPDVGRLLVATDLQGNLQDYLRIEQLYEQAVAEDPNATLVITGDLVHGPELPPEVWPDYLGSYFRADSAEVLLRAEQLAHRHEGRVFYLLGNHEHAHVGGPIVSKFFTDEANRLEHIMGMERSQEVKSWFASWPLVAVARHARLLMMHAAPNAQLESAADLDHVQLKPPGSQLGEVDPLLGQLLWARRASGARARAFLNAIDPQLNVAVYGHDVAREGHAIDREPMLCISTSFGCFDGDKLYLDWDLSVVAESAEHVARVGLRPLYPDRPTVHRPAPALASVDDAMEATLDANKSS